MNDNERS